jgi:chromosome partitioning protein
MTFHVEHQAWLCYPCLAGSAWLAQDEPMPEDPTPTPPSKLIAVVNQKGGVGKTTTAINLATAVAMEGAKTLLLDCDPQANTTSGLGFARNEERVTVYDLMLGATSAREATLPTDVENLFLIPGTRNMIGANVELVSVERRESRLREAIEPVRGDYQFIFLDCPPALDLLTLNALVAADTLLVPMQAEYFALEGISELMSTLDKVAAAFNPSLSLEGVLLTMYDDRTILSQQVHSNLNSVFREKMFKTTIPRNIRLAEAPSHGKPVALYDPRSRGAEAYHELALELFQRNPLQAPRNNRPRKRLILDDIPSPRPVVDMLDEEDQAKGTRFWPFKKKK